MDECTNRAARRTRAGSLIKWIAILAFIHLAFAGGMYVGSRILSPPPLNPAFAKALNDPKLISTSVTNSLQIKFHRLPSGAWISQNFVSGGDFRALTGSNLAPLHPNSPDVEIPVGNITQSEAAAFCRILTDKEHATGFLPKSHYYRLPEVDDNTPPISQGSEEWLAVKRAPNPTGSAMAVVEVDPALYAPEAEIAKVGWLRWHENLIAGPSGALQLPKDAAPKIHVSTHTDQSRNRLVVFAADTDPTSAAKLVNTAVAVIRNQCNALAKRRLANEFSYLRAEVDSAEIRNAEERASLLDLMAQYDVADTLDLPSWFLGREDLSDDLGIQTAKNNVERLKKIQKLLEDKKGGELPDLNSNPELSQATTAYLRIVAERKLLDVKVAQQKAAGASDTDPALVAIRAKISRNEEERLVARSSLNEDISRELTVAENLLIDLELVKRRRANQDPPPEPSPDQPRNEAVLESRITFLKGQIEQLETLRGHTLYDYALVTSEDDSPLRVLVPEFMKHRELGKAVQKAIAEVEQQSTALTNTPIANPPLSPPAPTPEETDNGDPEAAAKAKAQRDEAEKKAAEQLAKLTKEREEALKKLEATRLQKLEQLKAAESDRDVAAKAVEAEIDTFIQSLENSQEQDLQELEYLIAKRTYLLGWHRLISLRDDLAVKKATLDDPPAAATIVEEAIPADSETNPGVNLVTFMRGDRLVTAHPGYQNPELHFRVVLDKNNN